MIKDTFLKSLKENKVLLRQFFDSMTETEINRRIRDYWTIYQHLEHLAETQAVMLKRIELFLNEERPTIVPFTPEDGPMAKPGKKSVRELLDEFDRLRDRQIHFVKKAAAAVWRKVGSHPEYTKYSFEILLRHTVLHDSFHLFRIEQLWIMKEELLQELHSN